MLESFLPAAGGAKNRVRRLRLDDSGRRTFGSALPCGGHRAGTRRLRSRPSVALQPFQIGAHLRGALIAQLAVLLQRPVDDSFQLGWQIRVQPNGAEPERRSRIALKITPELSPRKGNLPVAIS